VNRDQKWFTLSVIDHFSGHVEQSIGCVCVCLDKVSFDVDVWHGVHLDLVYVRFIGQVRSSLSRKKIFFFPAKSEKGLRKPGRAHYRLETHCQLKADLDLKL